MMFDELSPASAPPTKLSDAGEHGLSVRAPPSPPACAPADLTDSCAPGAMGTAPCVSHGASFTSVSLAASPPLEGDAAPASRCASSTSMMSSDRSGSPPLPPAATTAPPEVIDDPAEAALALLAFCAAPPRVPAPAARSPSPAAAHVPPLARASAAFVGGGGAEAPRTTLPLSYRRTPSPTTPLEVAGAASHHAPRAASRADPLGVKRRRVEPSASALVAPIADPALLPHASSSRGLGASSPSPDGEAAGAAGTPSTASLFTGPPPRGLPHPAGKRIHWSGVERESAKVDDNDCSVVELAERKMRMNHLRRCNEDMRILMLGWTSVRLDKPGKVPRYVYEHPVHGRASSKKEIFRFHKGEVGACAAQDPARTSPCAVPLHAPIPFPTTRPRPRP